MPNGAAMQLHDKLEEFEHHLDTFELMASMGMASKEACVAMANELSSLNQIIHEFNSGNSVNDGTAKQAASTISTHAVGLYNSISNDEAQSDIYGRAKNFKEVLAQARRTWLTRDALNRMTVI